MYGPLVIAYLFLGGAAAGALFAIDLEPSDAWRIGDAANPLFAAAFDTLRTHLYAAGFVMLALRHGVPAVGLGVTARALLVLLRPHPTVLTFGAFTLAIEAALALLLASA